MKNTRRLGKARTFLTFVGYPCLVIAVSIALGVSAPQAGGRGSSQTWGNNAPLVPGQIVTMFRDDVTDLQIQAIINSQHATVVDIIPDLKLYLLQLPQGVDPRTAANHFLTFPEVLAADPNFVVTAAPLLPPPDPDFPEQWYLSNSSNNPGYHPFNFGFIDADIGALGAWTVSKGDPSIKIAILDTGIDDTHPDLAGKVLAQANFSSKPIFGPPPPPVDLNGHGTAVAGLAAAASDTVAMAGTCPLCSLLNAKVLDDNGTGTLFHLLQGINWAVVTQGASILNASLGAPGKCPGSLGHILIKVVRPRNAILVVAAGNNGKNLTTFDFWPANCPKPSVVTVAATDARDDISISTFTNRGAPIVDIAAPGVDVLSLRTLLHGGGTDRFTGTSMAAPIVSGALGVIWAHNPTFTISQVVTQMLQNADPIDGTVGYPGYGNNVNSWQYGRLNLCQALGARHCLQPLAGPAIRTLPACPPGGRAVTLDLSTGATNGVPDPLGTQDSRWSIVQVPSSTHGQLPLAFGHYPAFSTAPLPSQWVVVGAPTNANWIHPLNSPVQAVPGFWLASSKGFYRYQTQFLVPASSYANLTISGMHAEDDLATFYLNGNLIVPGVAGPAGSFAALTPFTDSTQSHFIIGGLNELLVEVENTASVTGLTVGAWLQATCK